MSPPQHGVILAAGRGSRMGPLAEHFPKALLPVANEPLILRHVRLLRRLGVREIFVVVGHHGDLIETVLAPWRDEGLLIECVRQTAHEGIAHALALLEARLPGPFYLILGDICFSEDIDEGLRHAPAAHDVTLLATAAVSDVAEVCRNFSVEMDPTGRVHRVAEKPETPPVAVKGCGFYRFTPAVFEAIRRTARSPLRNEFELTDAIQILIETGAPVFGAELTRWDVNVTVPADLIACNTRELADRGLARLVGRECALHPGAVLDGSAVGDGARITHPIRLERCVVLPGATVDATADLRDCVIAPGTNAF